MTFLKKIIADNNTDKELRYTIPLEDEAGAYHLRIPFFSSAPGTLAPEARLSAAAALRLAGHIHKEEYKAVIFSGSSAVLGDILLRLAWNKACPGNNLPDIYVLDAPDNRLLYRGNENIRSVLQRKTLVQLLIEKKYPVLNNLKQEKICYVDDVVDSGDKYRRLVRYFPRFGFTKVRFAFLAAKDRSVIDKQAFIGASDPMLARKLLELGGSLRAAPSLEAAEGPRTRREKIKDFFLQTAYALQTSAL